MDRITPEQRHKNMKAVKNKDSKIELVLRKILWENGYRYRKNYSKVFGKPDIVFIGKKVAIFCDSEFWHGYKWTENKNKIHSNKAFWIKKIERNIERDEEVNKKLENNGWKVLRFWGKEITRNPQECFEKIIKELRKDHEI